MALEDRQYINFAYIRFPQNTLPTGFVQKFPFASMNSLLLNLLWMIRERDFRFCFEQLLKFPLLFFRFDRQVKAVKRKFR